MTDFLVRVQSLTAGEKANTDETGKLTGALKEHRDVLAELIAREQGEFRALDSSNSKVREAREEYNRTTEEIEKAVKAGGSYAESLQAQALAADIFTKKLMSIPAVIPKLPHASNTPPDLRAPGLPAGLLSSVASPQLMLSQLALLPKATDDTRVAERALRMEADLSSASFVKLAKAFPTLTEGEVAATAAGQRLIAELTKADKLGSVADQFRAMKNTLIEEGDELGTHLAQTMGGAINGIEDQLAKLAVTGKANFKSLYQGIGEQIAKAGMQKGVSVLLSGLHIPGGGMKRDGATAQAAIYVTPVSDSGKVLGGILGGPKAAPPAGAPAAPGQDAGSMTQKLSGEFGSIFRRALFLFVEGLFRLRLHW